jgi:cytochrome P450
MRARQVKGDLPPGPPLPAAAQTALLWSAPERFLTACRRRYGGMFTVRDLGMGTLVYVDDPALVKQVFTGDPDVLRAGEGNSILEPVLGPRSLLLLDGSEHLRRRRQMLPPFHGEAVKRYGEVIDEVAAAELDRWPHGRPFAVRPGMQAITLEIILRAVIGVDATQRRDALRPVLRDAIDFDVVTMLAWLFPALERTPQWRRFQATLGRADALLHDEIARRRAEPGEDILSLLLEPDADGGRMTDAELRDQLMTLLLAGHETTATALSWALERLARHPRVLARLRASLDEGDDAYLDAVIKETLRVRPVIFDVIRRVAQPVEIGGRTLPAGAAVMPPIGLIHADPDVYPDPDAFRPERFLDAPAGTYTWLPFGGGTRRCLGAAFATFEMKRVLHHVVERFDIAPSTMRDEPAVMAHVTLVPRHGARVVLTPRGQRSTRARAEAAATVA